jgi:hypothetical protein
VGELRLYELLDALDVTIDERRVGQRPQMLSWLEFGGVRRQEEQVDVVGRAQALGGMPARAVKDQDDLLGRGCSGLAPESSEFCLK